MGTPRAPPKHLPTLGIGVTAVLLVLVMLISPLAGASSTAKQATPASTVGQGRATAPDHLSSSELSVAQASVAKSGGPPARWGASMVYDARDGYVLLFGGIGVTGHECFRFICRDIYGVLRDTWEFSNGVWTKVTPTGASPSARQWAAMDFDANCKCVLLFGGEGGVSAPFKPVYHDTWEYAAGTWTKIRPSASPPGVWQASMIYDVAGEETILFGGLNVTTRSETWEFSAGTWTRLAPSVSPSARGLASMAWDPNASGVVLFGGINSTGTLFDDTWTFSAGTWAKVAVHGHPSARFGAAIAYSAKDQYLVLFGGFRSNNPNATLAQTWTLTSPRAGVWAWAQEKPSVRPSARGYVQMASGTGSKDVVLFGGISPPEGLFHMSDALGDTWTFSSGNWTKV